MIELVGFGMILAGATLIAAALMGRPARGSGLTPELIKALQMPEYERIARTYCLSYGRPVEEWEQFASRAIGDIITRRG
jgi:hypothetical protein